MVICKSPAELEKMHQAGMIVWGALEKMRAMVKPGISTKELDEFAEDYTVKQHARPAFKDIAGIQDRFARRSTRKSFTGFLPRRESFEMATSYRWISEWS